MEGCCWKVASTDGGLDGAGRLPAEEGSPPATATVTQGLPTHAALLHWYALTAVTSCKLAGWWQGWSTGAGALVRHRPAVSSTPAAASQAAYAAAPLLNELKGASATLCHASRVITLLDQSKTAAARSVVPTSRPERPFS